MRSIRPGRIVLLVLVAFVVQAVGGVARAAGPLEPPPLDRYLRWGPFRVRPGFAVPALGYDNNILASGTSQPSVGAFGVRLSPRIEGVVLFGHTAFLTFRERVDYTAYEGQSDLNYLDHAGSYRLTVPFRRFGIYGDFAANRTKDPPLSEIDTRPVRSELRTGIGVLVQLGWRTEIEVGLVRSDWTVTDPDFFSSSGETIGDLQNRVEAGTRFKLRYRVAGRTRLTLDTTRREITFDNPSVNRDSHETVVLPGVELDGPGRIGGSVRVGPAKLDANDPAAPDLSTYVGDAKLAFRLSSATTLRIEALRRAGYGIYSDNRYYQDGSYEGRVLHWLNRIFGLEGAAGRGQLSYPETTDATARTDDYERFEAGVRFRLPESALGRLTEYSFFVRRWRRDSTLDILDDSRTVVGFGASVGF